VITNREKIIGIIDRMISRKMEINVRFEKGKDTFTSRFLGLLPPSGKVRGSKPGPQEEALVIEKLVPASGNKLLDPSRKIIIELPLDQRLLRFTTRYLGMSKDPAPVGVIIALPDSVELKELRRVERIIQEPPNFISVSFQTTDPAGKEQVWQLNVIDCSRHGLGLLVTEVDFDLLKMIKPGDVIKDITFYAEWTLIRVDATVKHITKIVRGPHKGQYVIGLESSEVITSCLPPDHPGS